MTQLHARHGDLVIEKIAALPAGLKLAKVTSPVVAGRLSSPHTVRGTVGIATDGDDTYVQVERATTLDHADRHLPAKLGKGLYHFYPQRERGGQGDRAVED
jgi:hypothetical protein